MILNGLIAVRPLRAAMICATLATAFALSGCGGGGSGGGALTGSISGQAYDASTLAAVGGATVSVGGLEATTESDGSFTLSGVPAGTVDLRVTKTSPSLTGQATVTVSAGLITSVSVPMYYPAPAPPPL